MADKAGITEGQTQQGQGHQGKSGSGKKKNKPKNVANDQVKKQTDLNSPRTLSESSTGSQGSQKSKGQGQDKGQVQDKGHGHQKPTDPNAPQKSKAQLKAERRALQEAQRAAKTAAKEGGAGQKKEGSTKEKMIRVPDHLKVDDAATQKKVAKKLEKQQVPQRAATERKVGLFRHLQQFERGTSLTQAIQFSNNVAIHPAVLKLGLQYAEGVVCGSNARCIALLNAFKQVIRDYTTPPQKELARDLDNRIKPCISFLAQCRPISVSMGNAIKALKWHINHTPSEMPDSEAKRNLNEVIEDFLQEKIVLAGEAISQTALQKIQDGDVLLVFGCSSLIRKILCDAHSKGRQFRVIVVDGRPKLEGREMLRRLVRHGIKCSYVLINTASYVMQEATKVFLGAHALLANGYVMSRVGTSQISLLAKAYNVPVLVCCETYKFCERVQTDSFVANELGDPGDLVKTHKKENYLDNWKQCKNLSLLNLVYDVTPPEFVTMVITEIGVIPCTSVPVVLRVKQTETPQ
ncbi:translation initiation factor eIF-2B subunit delta-like [Lingula anatina]|uniref:Translation initiation factor eIF2B subunit delta n=1 Tax=Lingula anatina TaxID=7574 RepID=A0A1S3JRR6_LINAN|nr:translation initiation factor eIF-2B subunit delta-like [Lingula anatina]|eukprot:XP_013413098.2 translation initiation factor eIF-2B subunit delta-like [Lingula anatina]